MKFDVAIIGGGPAGSAAAIGLGKAGARVLVLEKRRFPRAKLCGEFISPEAWRAVETLGASPRCATAAEIVRVRLHLYGALPVEMALGAPARGLNRAALDAALLDRARQVAAEVCEETTAERVECLPGGEFHVLCQRNGTPHSFEARAVICAAGGWSRWSPSGTRSHDAQGAHAFAFQAHFEPAVAEASTLDLYFFSGGYCGIAPVEGGRANLCCLIEKNLLRNGIAAGRDPRALLEAHSALAEPLSRGRRLSEYLFTGPLVYRRAEPVREGMLLAGDAAAFLDPFCGDGISVALHSGLLAAEALVPAIRGEFSLEEAQAQYARNYRSAFSRQFRWSAWLRLASRSPRLARAAARGAGAALGQWLFQQTRPAAEVAVSI